MMCRQPAAVAGVAACLFVVGTGCEKEEAPEECECEWVETMFVSNRCLGQGEG